MKLTLLFVTSLLLLPLIFVAFAIPLAAPLWLLIPALLFSTSIVTAVVLGRWFHFMMAMVAGTILVLLALALVLLWTTAVIWAVMTPWVAWPILFVALVALYIGLTTTPESHRRGRSSVLVPHAVSVTLTHWVG
jgi:hypothetical protein